MKTVFCNIPMRNDLENHKNRYTVKGNNSIKFDKEVVFPINMVMANKLTKEEKVLVVLLAKKDPEGNYKGNIEIFKQELNEINLDIKANIEYRVVYMEFDESTIDVHNKAMEELTHNVLIGSDVYTDITYGPKSLPIIMMSVLKFIERFCGCNIKDIVYGQVNFIDNKPCNPVLCNLRSLYHVTNMINMITTDTTEEAYKALNLLLNL